MTLLALRYVGQYLNMFLSLHADPVNCWHYMAIFCRHIYTNNRAILYSYTYCTSYLIVKFLLSLEVIPLRNINISNLMCVIKMDNCHYISFILLFCVLLIVCINNILFLLLHKWEHIAQMPV